VKSDYCATPCDIDNCSDAGGIEVEDNWDRVKDITIPTLGEAGSDVLAPLLGSLPLELRPSIEKFIQAAYAVGGLCSVLCSTSACPDAAPFHVTTT
jgi:hypothetical protein